MVLCILFHWLGTPVCSQLVFSACTSVSEGVFVMYPWREMYSTSNYSVIILSLYNFNFLKPIIFFIYFFAFSTILFHLQFEENDEQTMGISGGNIVGRANSSAKTQVGECWHA